jgi:hypothetical protein
MVNELALLQTTLVHAHIRELPEATFLEFECKSNKGRCGCWDKLHQWRARRLRCIVRDNFTFCWTCEVRTNAIEEWLYCRILYRRTQENG